MQTVIHTNRHLYYHCPGCKGHHSLPVAINVKFDKEWKWNGDLVKPTVAPSVKHFLPDSHYQQHPECPLFICHYHINEGVIEYCGDCTHALSGVKVPMTEFSAAEVEMHALRGQQKDD